jgi:hypothetical protein
MGGPTSSIHYRQHSSWDHVTTQAPPLRQSRGTFGGPGKELALRKTKVATKNIFDPGVEECNAEATGRSC